MAHRKRQDGGTMKKTTSGDDDLDLGPDEDQDYDALGPCDGPIPPTSTSPWLVRSLPRRGYRVREAARLLRVSPNTIRKRIAEGEIEARLFGEGGSTFILLDVMWAYLGRYWGKWLKKTMGEEREKTRRTFARLIFCTKDVADMYGVSPGFIRKEIKEGRLRARKTNCRVITILGRDIEKFERSLPRA